MVNAEVAGSLRRKGYLPKTDLFTRIQETEELNGCSFDMLFSSANDWGWKPEKVRAALSAHGMKVENVAVVNWDSDSTGATFTGDELSPQNPLVIVNSHLQYGRKFGELCGALEQDGRQLGWKVKPGTYAFFKRVYSSNDGSLYGLNTMVPVYMTGLDPKMVSDDMCERGYALWFSHDWEKGVNHYSMVAPDKVTGKKKWFSWEEHPFDEEAWRVDKNIENNAEFGGFARRHSYVRL
ncbi:MAG: hypothetical protein HYW23_00365 [Candidatus Aenigmarchaeota archaeon]|nr:hypothetical protein [Candidatus Aenigmarchaeota archaeon]